MHIGVIIPALNEASCLADVVTDCLAHRSADDKMRVVVCDNGSTDGTAAAAQQAGAEVVHESHRGYGAACLRAIEHLSDWPDVFVFVDGDGSSDCGKLHELLNPIRRDQADLVIGWRRAAELGSMTLPQRIGSWWFSWLLNIRWGGCGHDLGPFRAITRQALEQLCMADRTWGWTLEMQIKAILQGLRVVEVPVNWRRRLSGRSKISGSVTGVLRACGKISLTFARYVLCTPKPTHQPRNLVVAFTKYPRPGEVKSRLAATVGDEQAAQIYRRLAERCYRQLHALQTSGLTDVALYGKGRPMSAFKRWLPGARYYWPQPQGDLTQCLQQAFAKGFAHGAARVAAIATDSPALDAEAISNALGELQRVPTDVGIIPNTDGGYALIAMREHHPQLFEGVDWSTASVLAQTHRRAAELGLQVCELPAVPDIDTADDLVHLPPLVSIIMPVLNEEKVLRRNLPLLMQQIARVSLVPMYIGNVHRDQCHPIEVIVVDGGSADASREVAGDCGATVISSATGRGRQMNAGTAQARGEWLWYLHADCLPAEGAVGQMVSLVQKRFLHQWGYFRARLEARGIGLRTIEWGINLRSRWLHLPYGDQGLFVHREMMQHLGGFVESQLLEDVDAVVRLTQVSKPLRVATPLLINARRWQQYGVWRTTAINWRIMLDYLVLGKDIHKIARRYNANSKADQRIDVELQEGALF